MADNQHQGVMAMVKIDGDRVKLLREQKGLTQLYVATVVQVTTDTISRWENKRYPTIKKENAIRLAEALEVNLDAFLIPEPGEIPETDAPEPTPVSPHDQGKSEKSGRRFPLAAGIIFAAAVVAGIALYLFFTRLPGTTIEAQRFLPRQCTVNQPFPVAIEISVRHATKPISVIVKEELPENFTIIAAAPALPTALPATGSVKWLAKIESRAVFTYVVKISGDDVQPITGSISTGNDGGMTGRITGPNALSPSSFHWADANGDNMISDQEILLVYDQYGELEELGVNVDLIEEIWLGSGYSYNEATQSYEILP